MKIFLMKNYKKIRGIGIAWTALLCFFSVMQLSAQSAVGSSGPSPLLTIDGQNYQGYCVEYTQAAGPNGHGYNFDTTPEDITNPNVTAAMRGQSQYEYGTSATQSAIWYFTDNVTVSTGSSAQQIINKVLDGTYSPMCASEWTPNNYSSYQDVMTGIILAVMEVLPHLMVQLPSTHLADQEVVIIIVCQEVIGLQIVSFLVYNLVHILHMQLRIQVIILVKEATV